jgi:hypothetical protein
MPPGACLAPPAHTRAEISLTEKMPALLHLLHFGFSINGLVRLADFPPALTSTEKGRG